MKNTLHVNDGLEALFGMKFLFLLIFLMALFIPGAVIQAQCNAASLFTKITNTSGTATYPGTNGSPSVNVTTTSTGSVSTISYCGITNGFRAGLVDHSGSYRFAFSPAVYGIAINLNAVSNTADNREVVRIRINNVLYTLTAGNITCSGNCFSCTGSGIMATGGAIASIPDNFGNGVGQLLIQGVGLINSIEYINEVQQEDPQGSVFEIFFNNSTCILPVTLLSFTASGAQLNWQTAAEARVSQYIVERSTDGRNFETIGRITAKNSGHYQFTDATVHSEIYYYRLKIMDLNGGYQYSKTVMATVVNAGRKILFNNPVTDMLLVAGVRVNSTVAVYTSSGKEIARQVTGSSSATFETANWPTGLYIVKVFQNEKVLMSGKLVKL